MDWQLFLNILQATAIVVPWGVLGVSAWWFFKRRQRFPRANYTHRIEHWAVGSGKLLLRVVLVIENKGEVLLPIAEGCVRLYRVKPWPEELLLPVSRGEDPVHPGENEVDWPIICKRDLNLPYGPTEIEPGEMDEIPFDFVVDDTEQLVMVFSYVGNQQKSKRQVGWNKSTTYYLAEAKA